MFIRLLLFALPVLIILLFIREYRRQKKLAEKDWQTQWKQKKDNFKLEQDIKAKEKKIIELKDKLEDKD